MNNIKIKSTNIEFLSVNSDYQYKNKLSKNSMPMK